MELYFKKPRHRNVVSVLVITLLCLVIVALSSVIFMLASELENRPVIIQNALPQKVEELNLIQFRDRLLLVRKKVPLNKYSEDSYWFENGRMFYSGADAKAVFGIDVSYAQDDIDWKKVKKDGVEFAMLRIGFRGYSEGSIVLDKYFEKNIVEAQKAGIEVGVYFFSQALTEAEAREEARWVIEHLKGYDITYPVVFDWEFYSNIADARTNNMNGETLTTCAISFCDEINKAGYKPMVYFNMSLGYLYYDLSEMIQYDFWLAELDGPPIFHYNFQMLQYSHTGTVDGIKGDVDLNLCFVNYKKQ